MAELRRYSYVLHGLLPALILNGWACRLSREPEVGDLVMLQSAPESQWLISIYRGCGPGGHYDRRHTLESLKTGELCDWHNVGFHVLDLKACSVGERWTWTDEQFEFADKFAKVHRQADFYLNLPFIDRFDGELVHIIFRTRFGFDGIRTPVPPFAWKKISQKRLLQVLQEGESLHRGSRDHAAGQRHRVNTKDP